MVASAVTGIDEKLVTVVVTEVDCIYCKCDRLFTLFSTLVPAALPSRGGNDAVNVWT